MEEHNNQSTPKWLELQQQNSWQIEIFIASGFIFFLFNLPEFLTTTFIDALESRIIEAEGTIIYFGAFIFSRALLIGFAVILFLRALWLAFLGINYAFPQGINYEKLSYSDYFKKKTQKNKNVISRIIHLEKICSLTYSVTIFLTLLTIGIFSLTVFLFYAISHLAPSLYTPSFGYFVIGALFLMMLGITDFIFFGVFKKSESVSKIYYPFYILFKWLSLSFFYHQEMLTFISNSKRWKVYGLFLVYFSIAFVVSSSEIAQALGGSNFLNIKLTEDRDYTKPSSSYYIPLNYYDNMLEANDRIFDASIQSDIIFENYLRTFVVYHKKFDTTLDSLFRKNRVTPYLKRASRDVFHKNDSLMQKTFNEFFEVSIDKKPYNNNTWFFHDHHITGEKGFLTYLPIDSLSTGKHLLIIDRMHLVGDSLKSYRRGKIYFYKN